jgi:hypothetical protein
MPVRARFEAEDMEIGINHAEARINELENMLGERGQIEEQVKELAQTIENQQQASFFYSVVVIVAESRRY